MTAELHLPIDLDGRRVPSSTTISRPGGYLLALSTTIPERGLAIEVHSAYIGHPAGDTLSTHLLLAQHATAPLTVADSHEPGTLNPLHAPRGCIYDHAMRLSDYLSSLGHHAQLHIAQPALDAAETLGS